MNSLEEKIQLLKLPRHYTYAIMKAKVRSENNFVCTVRIAEVKDKETAMGWVKAFQKSSETIWRVARTHRSVGNKNIFRKDFRCQRKTDKRHAKDFKPSIDCRASLKVIVERYFEKGKLKAVTDEVKHFPCRIELVNIHNHVINKAAGSTFQPPIEPKLECSDENDIDYDDINISFGEEEICCGYSSNDGDGGSDSMNDDYYDQIHNEDESDAIHELKQIFNQIKRGLEVKPDLYKPALLKMISNAKDFANNENGLISAMYNFGVQSGPYILHIKSENKL